MDNSRNKLGRTQRLAARKAKWLAALAKAEAAPKEKPCRDLDGVLPYNNSLLRAHGSTWLAYSKWEHANRQNQKGVFD